MKTKGKYLGCSGCNIIIDCSLKKYKEFGNLKIDCPCKSCIIKMICEKACKEYDEYRLILFKRSDYANK